MKKKKKQKEDPRRGCAQCAMVYGMERPKMTAILDSKHFIALIADNAKKPAMIVVVPKVHLTTYAKLRENKDLCLQAAEFLGKVGEYCLRNFKGACDNDPMRIWKDGSHKINVSDNYRHSNQHLRAELAVTY
ncbi:hypothetical protein KGO95_02720 [Patescibacteria group bacterium]|nr:hypothetical protein [Patescibacteria group bacterium]